VVLAIALTIDSFWQRSIMYVPKKQCKCKTKDAEHISSNIINSVDALNLCHHLLVRLGSPYIY
jgi:hypothetical protein